MITLDILKSLEMIIIILLSVAYITLAERKIMGAMQRRVGPNIIGFYGILQPIVDGVKLFLKEILIPQQSNKFFYFFGPLFTFILCLIIYIPIPLNYTSYLSDNNFGILFILAISSLSVYVLLYSGWSSNSKYAFLGSIRSIAQLISYEVSIGIIILTVLLLNYNLPQNYASFELNEIISEPYINFSFNLIYLLYNQIYLSYLFPLFPLFILFFISALAETNRPPFDLAEAESELIAGYIVEFGGFSFAAIYLAEYAFILSMSILSSIIFIGSTNGIIISFMIFLFILIRATLPRIKYIDLMILGWTRILPISIIMFILTSLLIFIFA